MLQEQEKEMDRTALEQYKTGIAGQYESQRARAREAGEKQRTAAQSVYSFSGFGRSTAAANKAIH
jgi:hypothetical protein